MRYPSKDFHGMNTEEARNAFHTFISKYILDEEEAWCELITGQGPVKDAILEEIDDLGIEYTIIASNLGRIMIVV